MMIRRGPLALLLALAAPASAWGQTPDPAISALVEGISAERLDTIIRTLAGFGTRHTLSSTDSPTRGIGAARQWILDRFQASSPRLQVSFDTYQVAQQGRITRDVELRNVMAILPGRSPRRIYVSGHYDTVARPEEGNTFDWSQGDLPAPGANDDGSGTALVLELARVFANSGLTFDATLVFIAFAGEEQGLVGAGLHAARMEADSAVIAAVFNNDIVGGKGAGDGRTDTRAVRVFSDGPEDGVSRQLARTIREIAARYVPGHEVRLVARLDRFGRGGDHTPFAQRGYPAIRFTETHENYSRQHTVADTPEGVDPEYLRRNAMVNAAAVAELALAPAAPVVFAARRGPMLGRGQTGYDASLRWMPVDGAAGYRVVWRRAWNRDWEFSREVRGATELLLPNVSIDDYVFGVAAIGPNGHQSIVSAYVTPGRRPVNIRTR